MHSLELRRGNLFKQMQSVTRMERGTLSEEYRERVIDGKVVRRGPYYKHQCWEHGKNMSRRVPVEEVFVLKEALAGYETFQRMSSEYVETTIRLTRQAQEGKKKTRRETRTAIIQNGLNFQDSGQGANPVLCHKALIVIQS